MLLVIRLATKRQKIKSKREKFLDMILAIGIDL